MSERRRKILPGMAFTSRHNRHFLQGLSRKILETSADDLLSKLNYSNAFEYLQVLRGVEDEELPELCQPPVPKNVFYHYQVEYERENLHINSEHHKYANFLETLFKLNNYMIANCLEE